MVLSVCGTAYKAWQVWHYTEQLRGQKGKTVMLIMVFVSDTLNAAAEKDTKPDVLGRQPGHGTST